jgi:multiple sugar transport system substrate-binding protein
MLRAASTRRQALRALSLAATGALLAACGGGAPPAPTSAPAKAAEPAKAAAPAKDAAAAPQAAAPAKAAAGETTLVYWTFMATDQRFPARKEMFPRWGQPKQAAIQIEEIVAGNPFNQKMAAAYAAKLLPDLLDPWDSTALITFAAQDFVQDVDQVLKETGKDDFFPVGITFSLYKGKSYGLPLLGFPHLMHYRKDWFEEEGLKPPTTWEELYGVAQKLQGKKKDGVEISAVSGYFKSIHAPPFFQNMIGPNDGYTVDEAGKVAIDSKEVREAMQHVKNLVPFFQAGYANMEYGDTRNQFIEGKIAIEMDSTSMANLIVKAKPEMGKKVTSAILPFGPSSKRKRSGYNGLSYFAIGSQTKNADLARDFLKWFFSVPVYTEAFKSYDWGLIPERRSVADSEDWRKALPEQARPIIEAGVKAAELSTFPGQDFGPNPIGNKLLAEDVYRNLLQKVGSGEPIDAALKWAAGEVNRIMKEG